MVWKFSKAYVKLLFCQASVKLLRSFCEASAKLLSCFCVQIVVHNREFTYFALTFVRQWTAAKIIWKLMPKTIVAFPQMSRMKTVLKKNKEASQLKTVLERKSSPGLH